MFAFLLVIFITDQIDGAETMLDKKNLFENEERAILVGLIHKDQTEHQVKEYLDELEFLAETALGIFSKRATRH